MAFFPALEPDERSYDLGSHPIVTQQGWAGGSVRFRTGTVRIGAVLTLRFLRLVASQAAAIRTHYRTQYSGSLQFQLVTTTLSDPRYWVYQEPPQEEHRSGGLFDVTVTLRAVR